MASSAPRGNRRALLGFVLIGDQVFFPVDEKSGMAHGTDAVAFSLRGVEQERGSRRTLCGIDLDLPRREVVALVGPSGAGKTSLIRLLNRLDDPTKGSISFEGAPIDVLPVRALRRRVAFVFQSPVMFAGTVRDNLETAHRLGDGTARSPAHDEALRLAGLDESFLNRDAEQMSGGERQRVSLARALMTAPEVLLLDEPTSALDPEVAEQLMATVRRLAEEAAVTIIMVTHRLAEARAASSHTVLLEAGRVIETGPTSLMFSSPNEPRTREYLLGRERLP
jgi:ABC-type methionine transport system ATPase subunit